MKEDKNTNREESMSLDEQQRLAAEAGVKFLLISVCSILKNTWFTLLGLTTLFRMAMKAKQLEPGADWGSAVGFWDCLMLAICVWGIIDIKFKIKVRTE